MHTPDLIDARRSVLVLVDYQERLLPAIHDGEAAVAEAVRLADAARLLGLPVLGTEQYPQGLGPNTPAIAQRCDRMLAKQHFDACADGLLDLLPEGATTPHDVVIAGCESHVCLLQTAMGAQRAGHRCWVVEPACGSRSPRDHALAMQRLRQAGLDIVSAEMVIFEWLRGRAHPRFAQLLPLIKARP
ncbi:MAG: isochorismatase family protein [Aquabacterium sp.]|nr:MAG: isochorismatase family protein [Aquabacterium sp.]